MEVKLWESQRGGKWQWQPEQTLNQPSIRDADHNDL